MALSARKTDRNTTLARPLAHRLDLPEHEREISAEALAMLERGIREIRAGLVVEMPLSAFQIDDE